MKVKSKKLLAKFALLGAALIWGSSFFMMKNAIDVIAPHILLGLRFTIGCVLLSLIFCKKLKHINRDIVKKGALAGLFLFLAYSTQTIGLTDTTPGKNAFLTAVYCVIVPFLYWVVNGTKPRRTHFAAAALCLSGIGLVTLTQFTIRFGDALTLVGGFFYAAHMVAIARFSKGKDPVLLTIIQFATAAVLSWIVGLNFESFPTHIGADVVRELIYLSVFATAGALLLQNIGQKYTHPSTAAIILSLEAVFGVLLSVIFYGEQLTLRLMCGFVLIFVAIIISEMDFSSFRKKGQTDINS